MLKTSLTEEWSSKIFYSLIRKFSRKSKKPLLRSGNSSLLRRLRSMNALWEKTIIWKKSNFCQKPKWWALWMNSTNRWKLILGWIQSTRSIVTTLTSTSPSRNWDLTVIKIQVSDSTSNKITAIKSSLRRIIKPNLRQNKKIQITGSSMVLSPHWWSNRLKHQAHLWQKHINRKSTCSRNNICSSKIHHSWVSSKFPILRVIWSGRSLWHEIT